MIFQRGIRLLGDAAHDNKIVGKPPGHRCHGTFTSPVYVGGSMSVNVQADAHHNQIGIPGDANRDVISDNHHHGVALYDNGTNHNQIQNNLVGFTRAERQH